MKRLMDWEELMLEEIDGFKYLIPDNLSPMKHEGNCQGWHNTISKDKVERCKMKKAWTPQNNTCVEHHVYLRVYLADLNFERDLEEQLKNEKNPWRTTM